MLKDSTLANQFYIGNGAGGFPVVINSSNNVGIGTTNPAQKLEISGTALTDGIKFPDGSFQVTANKTLATTYYVNSTRSVFTATVSPKDLGLLGVGHLRQLIDTIRTSQNLTTKDLGLSLA